MCGFSAILEQHNRKTTLNTVYLLIRIMTSQDYDPCLVITVITYSLSQKFLSVLLQCWLSDKKVIWAITKNLAPVFQYILLSETPSHPEISEWSLKPG